jgi:hypothetical protein
MVERSFGDPPTDREVFDRMEAEAEERMYKESKLFAIASLMLIATVVLTIACIWLTVVRG